METLDIPTLRKIIVVKDALIATQQKLIAVYDSKILDLEDQLAAANTVIAECKQYIAYVDKHTPKQHTPGKVYGELNRSPYILD